MRSIFVAAALIVSVIPAQAQERQWSLDASGSEAFMVFGVADTDDVGLSFWCKIGSGKISIYERFDRAIIGKAQSTPVKLKIDSEEFDIKMQASVGNGSNSGSLEGPVSVTGTVMNAVSRASEFSITAFGRTMSYPLMDADVDGLLKTCSEDAAN